MEKAKYCSYLDYLLPAAIWLLIFGKNIFSNMVFVDYVPSVSFDVIKLLKLYNYSYVFSLFDALKLIFALLGLLSIIFQFSILIAMFVSYFYIKKLFIKKGIIFPLVFAFIYFFNPFVYTRIMVGQLGVVLSYLLVPASLYYIFVFFLLDLDKRSLIKLVISMTLVSLFEIHFFVINFVIFLVASFWFYFFKNKFEIKKYLIYLSIIISLLILLNVFWIQGLFSSGIFSVINTEHKQFFSPKMSQNIPAVAKIMSMWGFWRENGMIAPYLSFPHAIWYLMVFLLITLFLIGFFNFYNKKSFFFFTLFWIGVVFGTGISHPYTKPFFDFLFNYLPLFNGFRDSHKLVSLIALAYAFFIPLALVYVREKYKKLFIPFLVFIVIFILFFTFPLIGLWNQEKSVQYPIEYIKVGKYLDSQNISGYIIYLPWQTYLTYNWTYGITSDGRIASPINQIIKQPVIIGPDEFGSPDRLQNNITYCLSESDTSCLENIGVEFVIKDKCAYFLQNYSMFKNPIYENNCISLYKLNNSWVEKQKVPLKFIISAIISILTLIILIFLLTKNKKIIPLQVP